MKEILVTIGTYIIEVSVFIKEKLEENNIECFLSEFENKIKIQVKSTFVEKAINILFKIKEENGTLEVEKDISGIKKILCGIDFSEYSKNATKYAFGFAHKIGAEIKMVYVYDDPYLGSSQKHTKSFETHSNQVLAENYQRASEQVIEFNNSIKEQIKNKQLFDVKYHFSIIPGQPEKEILRISKIYEPEIIVLGTRGVDEKPNSLIGDVTSEIIENTNIPILAVPNISIFQGMETTNILYATDFQDSDHTALERLLSIVSILKFKLYCIHVDSSDSKKTNELKMKELGEYLSEKYKDHKIECHILKEDDLFIGIQKFVDDFSIDLISFSSPRKGIFQRIVRPSQFKDMIFQSKVPLLIFRF